jgi:RNA polymerase sigma-70 factor (ECF subfamily)
MTAPGASSEQARRTAEQAARTSYGRLLAILVAHTRDIAGAQDALGEAFVAALTTWPARGVPHNPDAWLLTTARNRSKNIWRHQQVTDAAVPELLRRTDELHDDEQPLRDERLKLLFVCAHPAIDEAARTPLMLQTVLGLDAARIASAFLTSPATMSQRLVRAKARINDAGLRIELPDDAHLAERLEDVLAAIYVAYGVAFDVVADGADAGLVELKDEAIFLARLLVELLPGESEPRGLLALMLYAEARRPARRDSEGRFVPLANQDPTLWHTPFVVEAEALLAEGSARARGFGRFLCEAAIQSVHVQRAVTGVAQHEALCLLYDVLVAHVPSLGARLGRAAARLAAGDVDGAAAAIADIAIDRVERHQPYWVTQAQIHEARGDVDAHRSALLRAIGLTEDPAVRAFLQSQLR